MSQPGKFIPGGAGRKTTGVSVRTGPIRAPVGGAPPEEPPKKANRLLSKGGGFNKPVPKNRRLPIVVMSAVVCCLLVSSAWYLLSVIPMKRALQLEQQKEAAAQKQLADSIAQQKEQQEALLKQQAAARATVIVNSTPAGTVTIGGTSKPTPATIDDAPVGKITVSIHADGYETYQQNLTVTADKPTDLGTIQLVPLTGNLSLVTSQTDVTYTLTGPDGYSHDGQLPDKLQALPAGDYQLTVRQHDWQLPPLVITIHDRDQLQKEIDFPYGSVSISSIPSGATVRKGNVILGQTPLNLAQVRPGPMDLSVDLPPYTLARLSFTLPDSGQVAKQVTLTRGRDFISACGMAMVWIPDGYWVGKYDVTQREFETVAGFNPSTFRRPNRPVETVSWETAMAFCDKLNQWEERAGTLPRGFHYTLPTETQWEAFSADANIDLAATSRSVALSSTQDVGASEPNKFGLYDTLGNVWEWCLDAVDDKGDHTLRGGNWLSSMENFPSAETRTAGGAKYADRFTGFRVVLVPQ